MSMNKRVTIPMETTAYYQSESKLNVRFWNQDINTAELQFLITRNNFPLSLSEENVKVILTLESGESFITTDDLDIENEVEGVATYIIPPEFMAVATSVVGQIYVTTIDGDEIVVQRKFSFTVENDLLSTIPSEEKIRYIKMFSDLQEDMSTRLGGVETALTQLEANIDAVNNARQNGIAAISNLYDAKLVTFNQNFDDKMALINDSMNDMESYVDTSLADMTAKKEAFDSSVLGSGLVTTGQSDDWQKFKLTDNSGILPIVNLNGDLAALQALPSGFYYRSYVPITGMGQTSQTGFVTVWESNGGLVKNISFKPYNSTQEFIMIYYNEWSSWTNKFDGLEKSIDAQSKANVAENNAKVYTDSKIDEQHNILFSGSVNGVNSTVNLTGSMNDYEFIIISGDCSGNDFSQIVVPSVTGSIVNMQNLNLRDTDGLLLGVYEVRLEITSTTIKITNDVAYDHPSDTGSGPNRNAYTITRVEGVHKK